MATYFHAAPILLAPGSVIEPGNFGRIIRLVGAAHPLVRRETAYEAFRQQHAPDRPSRLECLFCFPTLDEANLARTHINGYASSVVYEVESGEKNPHLADMNNALLPYDASTFDSRIIAYYWRGWSRSPDPKAAILREILLRDPVTILRRVLP